MEQIINIVCQTLDISPELLLIRTRKKSIVRARFFCFYFLRKYSRDLPTPFSAIGERFNLEHATVIHGVKDVEHRFIHIKEERAVINMIWRKLHHSPYIIKPNYETILFDIINKKPEAFSYLGIDDVTLENIFIDLQISEEQRKIVNDYVYRNKIMRESL